MKQHIKFFYIFFVLLTSFLSAQQNKIDSLFTELKKWQNKNDYRADTTLYNIYYNLGKQFLNSNPDTSIYFFKQSIIKAQKIKDAFKEVESIKTIGWCYYLIGDYNMAMQQYELTLKLLPKNVEEKDKIRKQKVFAAILLNIGTVHWSQGNYAKTLEYYFKALKIDEEIGNKKGQAIDLGNIGNVYNYQNNYIKALEYYFKALKIDEELKNKNGIARHLANIGLIYSNQRKYDWALENFFRSLKTFEEIGNKQGQSTVLGNIGIVYNEEGNYSKALEYYSKALKICDESGDKRSQALHLGNMGSLYRQQKKYKESENCLKKAITISEELHDFYYLQEFYISLSELYSKIKKYKDALEAYKKYVICKDSLDSRENKKALATKEMQYLFEKKQVEEQVKHEKMMALAKVEKRKQKIIIWAVSSGFVLILIFAIFIYRSLRITKKQKEIIEEAKNLISRQKEEVELQKHLVEEKNKEITDSIHYAKRIQQSILTDDNEWKRLLPDSFIIYLPKDIVAGDFYWLVETDIYIYVAAADCTGHGVPGAMVSVTCNNALNKSVLEEKIINTNEILTRTRQIVVKQLYSQQGQLQDGMDICLVRINKDNPKQIQYSGANRPLVVVNNGELKEYTPDKQPIGYYEGATPFNAQDIELSEGSYLYLFTDGYADQFGGEKNKKLGTKRWKEMLKELAQKTTEKQEEYLREFITQWRGNEIQTDDVTVIGIRC